MFGRMLLAGMALCAHLLFIPCAANADSRQPLVWSRECPTGGERAEQLYQLAVDYQKSRNGITRDVAKAKELFEAAIQAGSAKATLAYGMMLRQTTVLSATDYAWTKLSVDLYRLGMRMQCPEAGHMLAEAYENGWGVKKDLSKAISLLKKAAEQGSLVSMVSRAELDKEDAEYWLTKALEAGHGYAGQPLSYLYFKRNDTAKGLAVLRQGAALGSADCLFSLKDIYQEGRYGQEKDTAYAEKMNALWEKIDMAYEPKPIPDFDTLFPPKPVSPYSWPGGTEQAAGFPDKGREAAQTHETGMLAKAAGFFAKDKEPGKRPVYSRLTVQNRCYGRIKSEMEEYKKYFGYSSRWVRARDTEYFELWQGEKTPDRIYDITRDSAPYGPVRRFDRWGPKEKPKEGAPQLRKTLASMVMEADAEASATFLQDIRINEYTYTFCKDEPPLGTPDAEFARPAKRGEQIDIFEIYLTQIPGSRKKEHAYCNYPLLFFLNGYPLFSTRSDDEGYARIPLPKGTQGRLGILSEAFDSGDGHLLYDEWTPVKFFTAKGGEMVYRIPPHKNITGW